MKFIYQTKEMETKKSLSLANSLDVVFNCYYTIMQHQLALYLATDMKPEILYQTWKDLKILCRLHNEKKGFANIQRVTFYGTTNFNLLFEFKKEFQIIFDSFATSTGMKEKAAEKWELLTDDFLTLPTKSPIDTINKFRSFLSSYPLLSHYIQPAIERQQEKIDLYFQDDINGLKW